MQAILDEDVKRAIILEGQLIKAESAAKELALLLDSLDTMVGDPFADWPGTITRIQELLKQLKIKIPIEALFAEKGLKLDQEKITLEMARTMLSAGFGLTAEEVNTLLGVQEQAFSEPQWGEEDTEDYGWGDEEFKVLQVVASKFGSSSDDYVVMHSKPMRFDTDLDDQVRQAFAELGEEEKELDKKIEAYRKKNRDASVEEMAKEFGVSKAKVAKRVAYLITKDRYPIARAVDQIANEGAKPTDEPVLEVRYKYSWAAGFSNKYAAV